VSALILDAGALVAIDRDDRDVHKKIRDAQRLGLPVRTNPMVLAQAWRNGSRQARLVRVLRGVQVVPITREDGERAGELLGAARTDDPIDATVVLLARAGDQILTSDLGDLRALAEAAGREPELIRC
jgi:hypothetical protein